MAFEQYAPARDIFYLAALLLGAGLGCILNRFRRRGTTRFRNISVTAGLCFLSGAAAALVLAAILSNWAIFFVSALYMPTGAAAVLMVLCFRFPKAAGLPIFLVAGVFVVWTGYAIFCFPASNDSASLAHKIPLHNVTEDTALETRSIYFTFPKEFPLTGGVKRGAVAEITSDGKSLYANPLFGWKPVPGQPPGSSGGGNTLLETWGLFFPFHEERENQELPGL